GVADQRPRVAVRGYPGTRDQRLQPRRGCRSKAQGCRSRLPWDPRSENPTPKGLQIKSPGLPSAATLGPAIRESNPEGVADQKPRVAVRGYPGTRDQRIQPRGVAAYCLLPHKNHVQLLRAVNAYNQRELDVRGSARASYEGDRTWSFVGRIKLNE